MRRLVSLSCMLALVATASFAAIDPTLKSSPYVSGAKPPTVFPEATVTEGFEANLLPPSGWALDSSNTETWKISTGATPHGGAHYADCEYDPALAPQSEALYSPLMVRPTTLNLSFWSFGSLYWCRDTFDNCDLDIYLDLDTVFGNGNETLVYTADADWTASFTWSSSVVDLSASVGGEDRYLAFVYAGTDGAQVALDDIVIDYAEAPQQSVITIPTLGLAGLLGLGLLLAASAVFLLSRRG